MFKNTKFYIEITDSNNPNTVTTYINLRYSKLIEHCKNAMKVNNHFKVFIKFKSKLGDGSYRWDHGNFEFMHYNNETKKYRFFNQDDLTIKEQNHVFDYERRIDRDLKYYW